MFISFIVAIESIWFKIKSTKYFTKKSDGINVRFIDQPATKKPYIGIIMPGLSAADVDFSSFLLKKTSKHTKITKIMLKTHFLWFSIFD